MPTVDFELNGLKFEWDDDKQELVVNDHQILFTEACSVFFDEHQLTYDDTHYDWV